MFSEKKWFYLFLIVALFNIRAISLGVKQGLARINAILNQSKASALLTISDQEKNLLLETLKPIFSSLTPLDSLNIDSDVNFSWMGRSALATSHFASLSVLEESSLLEFCENRLFNPKGERNIQFIIVCRLTEEVRDTKKISEAVKQLEKRLREIPFPEVSEEYSESEKEVIRDSNDKKEEFIQQIENKSQIKSFLLASNDIRNWRGVWIALLSHLFESSEFEVYEISLKKTARSSFEASFSEMTLKGKKVNEVNLQLDAFLSGIPRIVIETSDLQPIAEASFDFIYSAKFQIESKVTDQESQIATRSAFEVEDIAKLLGIVDKVTAESKIILKDILPHTLKLTDYAKFYLKIELGGTSQQILKFLAILESFEPGISFEEISLTKDEESKDLFRGSLILSELKS